MSELNAIARPYAKAAFEFALEQQQLESWEQVLELLSAIITNESVQALLTNPLFHDEQMVQLIEDVCKDKLDQFAKNFVKLLAQNDRLVLLPLILQQYTELKDQHLKLVDVDVISAFSLPDELQQKLQQALEKKYQCQIQLNSVLDSNVIGGAMIKIGDKVIDGTALGKLNLLQNSLNMKERICQ